MKNEKKHYFLGLAFGVSVLSRSKFVKNFLIFCTQELSFCVVTIIAQFHLDLFDFSSAIIFDLSGWDFVIRSARTAARLYHSFCS